MAIIIKTNDGPTIRGYLDTLAGPTDAPIEYAEIVIKNGSTTKTLTTGSIQLVWEGSQYYLVHTDEDKVEVRNLDDCLPMEINKTTSAEI